MGDVRPVVVKALSACRPLSETTAQDRYRGPQPRNSHCTSSWMSELCIMEESSAHRQLKKVDILHYRVERIEHICALMSHEAPRVYTYRGAHITVDKVAALIKLPSHQSALVGSGNIKGWKLKLIEDHLSSLAEKEDWSAFNKTLALIVFGTTLFPFHADTVDHAAMDAFFAWDVHLRSPVPAILADTLLSVNFCHQKQGKTLRCCSTLLYVWGITHFYTSSHMGMLPDPLRSFSKIPLRRRYAMEWKDEVEHWSVDHFSWICPWFRPGDILIRCGDYPSELGGLCFFRESVNLEELHAICKAWEKPVYMGDRELGKARASVSIDYEEWRKRRGVPQPSTLLVPASADSELQNKVDALTKKLEIMGAQQCKKKDQEIERLKNECADFNEEAIQAAKVQKLNSDSRLQEVTAKIAHLEAEYAKQAQLIKMMQDDLTMTRSEAQKWWEVAHKRSTSLSEFQEKEKKGLAQIGQLCEERDRAIDKANELQALISFYKEKTKEAQANCDNMSRAVHQQAEVLAPVPSTLHQKVKFVVGDKLVTVQAEDDMLISKPSTLPYVDAVEEAIETSFQALEIANVEKHPRDMKKVIRIMAKNEYYPGYDPAKGQASSSKGKFLQFKKGELQMTGAPVIIKCSLPAFDLCESSDC
ncbi:hypothetical protein Fmac_026682 [Flemingia macrophylla]|uniref:DUF7745 domain-containing protein n=1 Tax=Flemingia macrophylla TaxID=520843 RepID=A0ABD1LFI2_9FABA